MRKGTGRVVDIEGIGPAGGGDVPALLDDDLRHPSPTLHQPPCRAAHHRFGDGFLNQRGQRHFRVLKAPAFNGLQTVIVFSS